MRKFIIAAVLLSTSFAYGKRPSYDQFPYAYQGILVDMSILPGEVLYSIGIGDLVYTVHCTELGLGASCPKHLIVGDPVEVRLTKNTKPLEHSIEDKGKRLLIVSDDGNLRNHLQVIGLTRVP